MRNKIMTMVLAGMLALTGICQADVALAAEAEQTTKTVDKHVLPKHEHNAQCVLTKAEPVQIICILDRSGSMRNLVEDTIGGYNSFIEKQKAEPGEAQVTTVLFDNEYEKLLDAIALTEVPEMTSKEYYPRGSTALLDAVGRTVMETAGKMEKEGVCPAKRKVLFMIMTDGLENASHEYDSASVKAMINEATKDYKWNFIFMGANIDSVAEAQKLGIDSRYAVDYEASADGVGRSFARMDAAAQSVRNSGELSEDWKSE